MRLYEDATRHFGHFVTERFGPVGHFTTLSFYLTHADVRGCRPPLCYGVFRACWEIKKHEVDNIRFVFSLAVRARSKSMRLTKIGYFSWPFVPGTRWGGENKKHEVNKSIFFRLFVPESEKHEDRVCYGVFRACWENKANKIRFVFLCLFLPENKKHAVHKISFVGCSFPVRGGETRNMRLTKWLFVPENKTCDCTRMPPTTLLLLRPKTKNMRLNNISFFFWCCSCPQLL